MLMLIRGLPGSGKSSLANNIKEHIHLEADMFFVDNGVYKFNPETIRDAHMWCLNSAKIFLHNGKNVVVSNTFTQKWEMDGYLKFAADLSIKTTVYRCNRNFGSVHDIPVEIINRMRDRFEDYEGEIII